MADLKSDILKLISEDDDGLTAFSRAFDSVIKETDIMCEVNKLKQDMAYL